MMTNTCAVVIVHGQSEYALVNSIKSKLRVNLEVYGRRKGKEPIQIDSLSRTLGNDIFRDEKTLLKKYPNISRKSRKELTNFKIFTLLDTDDCSDISVKKNYMDGYLSGVSNHPLKEYFVPIYNDGNLEDVLSDIGFPFVAKTNKQKKEYISVFNKGAQTASEESIRELCEKVKNSKKTNLDIFLKYMLDHKFEI